MNISSTIKEVLYRRNNPFMYQVARYENPNIRGKLNVLHIALLDYMLYAMYSSFQYKNINQGVVTKYTSSVLDQYGIITDSVLVCCVLRRESI